jgi:hypothetical protein
LCSGNGTQVERKRTVLEPLGERCCDRDYEYQSKAGYDEMAINVATAKYKWVEKISRNGGDPDKIFISEPLCRWAIWQQFGIKSFEKGLE